MGGVVFIYSQPGKCIHVAHSESGKYIHEATNLQLCVSIVRMTHSLRESPRAIAA